MNEFTQRLVHLHHCRGASWKTIFAIIKRDPQLKFLYNSSLRDCIPPSAPADHIQEDLQSDKLLNMILRYKEFGIDITTLFDSEYPEMLRETYNPPWVLYVKGDSRLLSKRKRLAVVGSRNATAFGKKSIELLFPKLIEQQTVIVSGLALGIDTHAHQTAMKLGGQTIVVIAGGFHHLYPKENAKLAEQIMKEHLIISEYSPSSTPQKWHFPMRNRIIAGISHGTLIIEAKKRSGSLITADCAMNEGREVFAVPGPIMNPFSAGTNELIQQGAKLVTSAQDILEELSDN